MMTDRYRNFAAMPAASRRLLIHVGPPKTGTSAVQHYLRSEQTPGLIYPEAGRWADGAHHNLIFNFFEDRRRPEVVAEQAEALFARIAAECAERPGDVLISSELLVAYDIRHFVDAAYSALGAQFAAPELLFTYRDHFIRAASLYNQCVKDGFHCETRDPDAFLREEAESMLYALLVARLEETGHPVRMVSYHPSGDFLARFLAACGYAPAEGIRDVRRNVSLSVAGMITTLAVNRAAATAEERRVLFDAVRRIKGFYAPSRFIFGAEVFAVTAPIFEADRLALQARFATELPPTPETAPENDFALETANLERLADIVAPLGEAGARLVAVARAFVKA